MPNTKDMINTQVDFWPAKQAFVAKKYFQLIVLVHVIMHILS